MIIKDRATYAICFVFNIKWFVCYNIRIKILFVFVLNVKHMK